MTTQEPESFLTREDLLIGLMEECAEVIKAASKCLRFGYNRAWPGYGRNDLVLAHEIGDVVGIANELHRRGLSIPIALAASHDKLAKMEQAKRMIGHVEEREQSNSHR